jgi:hypothetical protein
MKKSRLVAGLLALLVVAGGSVAGATGAAAARPASSGMTVVVSYNPSTGCTTTMTIYPDGRRIYEYSWQCFR